MKRSFTGFPPAKPTIDAGTSIEASARDGDTQRSENAPLGTRTRRHCVPKSSHAYRKINNILTFIIKLYIYTIDP